MISRTLPSYWSSYLELDDHARSAAANAFRLWPDDPFHPSLRFKLVNASRNYWSARVTRGIRAPGVRDGDTVTWTWIGRHDEYLRQLR